MFPLFTLLAIACLDLCPAGAAAPPEAQKFPASWQKVTACQYGHVAGISVRDGFLVWMEKKLDPKTALNRAEGFWWRVYRLKLDGPQNIQTLYARDDEHDDVLEFHRANFICPRRPRRTTIRRAESGPAQIRSSGISTRSDVSQRRPGCLYRLRQGRQ